MHLAGADQSARIENLLAIIPGRDPRLKGVLFTAHYDSAPHSRGAADDGAGVATLLEATRALRAGPQLKRNVYLLFADAEEVGLLGALAFVKEHPLARDIGFVVNFEARGTGGPELMYHPSPHNGALLRAFARCARYPHANSLISRLSRVLPNDADTSIYERSGYPVLGFAFAEGLENYHGYSDSFDNLDIHSLAHAGTLTLDLARHFAGLDNLPAPEHDAVYFDLFGRYLVTYSTFNARIFAVLLTIAWAALLRREVAKRRVRTRAILHGAKLQLFCLSIALLVPVMLMLIRSIIVEETSLVRNAPAYGASDFLVVTALFLSLYSNATRKNTARELVMGGLSVTTALALFLGLFLPDASAPWQWVLGVSLLVWWLEPKISARSVRLGVAWQHVALGFAIVILGPIVMTAIAVAGPALMPLPIVIGATAACLFMPTLLQTGIPKPHLAAIVLATTGFGLMLATGLVAGTAAAATRRGSLVYAYDATTQKASLATEAKTPGSAREAPATRSRGADRPSRVPETWRLTAAPPAPTRPSRVTVRTVAAVGERRAIELEVEPDASVLCVRLWQFDGSPITTELINGKPVEPFVRFSPEFDEFGMQLMSGQFSAHVWNLRFCGFEARPLLVRLQVPKLGKAKLRLIEEREAFPELIGEKLRSNDAAEKNNAVAFETWIAQDIEL